MQDYGEKDSQYTIGSNDHAQCRADHPLWTNMDLVGSGETDVKISMADVHYSSGSGEDRVV